MKIFLLGFFLFARVITCDAQSVSPLPTSSPLPEIYKGGKWWTYLPYDGEINGIYYDKLFPGGHGMGSNPENILCHKVSIAGRWASKKANNHLYLFPDCVAEQKMKPFTYEVDEEHKTILFRKPSGIELCKYELIESEIDQILSLACSESGVSLYSNEWAKYKKRMHL